MKNFIELLPAGLGLGALLLVSSGRLRAEENASWEIKKSGDQEYVPLDQVGKFYAFSKSVREDSNIVLENQKVSIHLKVGSPECLMNGIKFVFGSPVTEIENTACISRADLSELLDPTLRPTSITGTGDFQTIILDPAHGGKDAGITNDTGTEAEYTLKIAHLTKTMLEAKGFKIVMTRDGDASPSLQERVDLANAVGESAIFIGISLNSGAETESGIETIPLSISAPAGDAAKSGRASVALSTSIHGSIIRRLGKNTTDRGIRRAPADVLSGVHYPSILVKAGYMTHAYEARLIANQAYQNAIAAGISDGVGKYRVATTTAPKAPQPAETE